ncbi:hypothetical protein FKM82_024853 [Ascaphus truei]
MHGGYITGDGLRYWMKESGRRQLMERTGRRLLMPRTGRRQLMLRAGRRMPMVGTERGPSGGKVRGGSIVLGCGMRGACVRRDGLELLGWHRQAARWLG